MEVTNSFLSRGYPHWTRAVYVYCDKCGSFSIKKIPSTRQGLMVLGGVVIIAMLIYTKTSIFIIFFSTLMICIVAAGLWGMPGYECKKCGYTTTIKYNTRNYPSNKSVVDVPEEQIEKFYLGYWPDEGDLEEYLKPPPLK